VAVERKPVVLEAWGATDFARDRARQDGLREAANRNWEVVEIEESTAERNPIRRRSDALARGRAYNLAWAIHAAPAAADGQGEQQQGRGDG